MNPPPICPRCLQPLNDIACASPRRPFTQHFIWHGWHECWQLHCTYPASPSTTEERISCSLCHAPLAEPVVGVDADGWPVVYPTATHALERRL